MLFLSSMVTFAVTDSRLRRSNSSARNKESNCNVNARHSSPEGIRGNRDQSDLRMQHLEGN